jgi:hypothetical protein
MTRADEKRKAETTTNFANNCTEPFARAETYDLGNGQRGSDVARNDSMMEPFFPKCKGAPLFTHLHVLLPFPFSSMAWGKGWLVCACV